MGSINGSKIIQKFKMLYLIYFTLSILFAISSLVWIILLYLLGWKDFVTLFDLFMVGVLVVTTFYLRVNAFHYQLIYMKVQKQTLNKNKSKKDSKLAKKR